jgi:hypothetical protein
VVRPIRKVFGPDRIGIVGFHAKGFVIARPAEPYAAWLQERAQLLHTKIRRATRACSLHAFFSREAGDESPSQFLRKAGWYPHPYDIQVVRTHRGTERRANSDLLIVFEAARLVSHSDADVVAIGTGDGALAADLTAFLLALPTRRRIVTLSLAGSTSWQLDARRNPLITANVEIGHDCLRRCGVSVEAGDCCEENAHEHT